VISLFSAEYNAIKLVVNYPERQLVKKTGDGMLEAIAKDADLTIKKQETACSRLLRRMQISQSSTSASKTSPLVQPRLKMVMASTPSLLCLCFPATTLSGVSVRQFVFQQKRQQLLDANEMK